MNLPCLARIVRLFWQKKPFFWPKVVPFVCLLAQNYSLLAQKNEKSMKNDLICGRIVYKCEKMPSVVAGMYKNVAQLCNYVTQVHFQISLPLVVVFGLFGKMPHMWQ